MSSQCPVREGVGIDNAPLREGAGIVGRADTRPDTAPQPLPTQAVDPDLCLPAKKTAPAPPDNATPQTTPPPPAPVTVSVEDMSVRLADTAPGQTVVVFVGKGQSLGLVGGVAYQHPIAVTAFPASSVTALLAASHDQSAAGAAAGADGALVTAGDLAEGFPALQIAVDPADRCALAHATTTDSDSLSESVLLERPDHSIWRRRGSSGGVSVPRKGLRRSADGFVRPCKTLGGFPPPSESISFSSSLRVHILFFLPPSPYPSLAFTHQPPAASLAHHRGNRSTPSRICVQSRARPSAHRRLEPASALTTHHRRPAARRFKPLDIALAPTASRRRRRRGLLVELAAAAAGSCRLNRLSNARAAACGCPAADCSREVTCRTNRNGTAAVDNGGIWIVQVLGPAASARWRLKRGGVVERREGGGVYRLGKRTRASNLLRVRSPQRPREMGARRKGAPRSWGREPWSGVAAHRAAAGAWPGPMITVH